MCPIRVTTKTLYEGAQIFSKVKINKPDFPEYHLGPKDTAYLFLNSEIEVKD